MRRPPIRLGLAASWLIAVMSGPAYAESAPGAWQGRYRYEHDAGRTVGGTGIAVTYDLALGPAGARGGCLLSMTGFRTGERIVCRIRAEGESVTVAFHHYADGSTVDRYGVAVYKPGEPLFTLAKGEGTVLTTRWHGLKPDGGGVADTGVFFAKAK